MNRRVVVTVAVVSLLVLSGCSALLDGNGATPRPSETPAPTETPGQEGGEGTTAAGGPDEAADAEYPTGYGPDGITNRSVVVQLHVGALVDYGSHIFSYNSFIEGENGSASYAFQQPVNHSTEMAYTIEDGSQFTRVSYFESDRRYVRFESDGEVSYNATDRAFESEDFTGSQFVGPLLLFVEYGEAAVLETDQGPIYEYESTAVLNPEAVLRSDVDEDRIDRFNVTIRVDENGAVRQASFRVEADRDVTVTMGVSELGSTDPDRPEWFEQARDS
jgi:hypothetical protein